MAETTRAQRSSDSRVAVAQSIVVGSSFAMLLAGSNAVNPLLPIYRDQLGLDPLVLSLTFVLYVAVLVCALFFLARPGRAHRAAPFLLASLALLIASDLLLAHAQEWSILAGRVCAGLSGGLGTGAASALVVAAIGAKGRAVTATGNFVGGVLGAGASQLVVSLVGEAAPQAVFLGHAAIVAALLLAAIVVLRARRDANRADLAVVPGTPAPARIGRRAVRMFATGTIAWAATSVAVVFGATVFADLGQPLVQAIGPTLLLGTSAAAQLASPAIARIAPWVSGAVAMGMGIAGILSGAWLALDALAIAGFAVLGAGVGVSFRAALVALTRGATPSRQGSLASLYAAVTYTVSAATVLAVGWAGNTAGLVPAVLAALGTVGVLSTVAVIWVPRLRDTFEPDLTPIATEGCARR
ncbi:MFS transporter [Okibacterium endophyticum]